MYKHIYGGLNKKNPPFDVGDVVKQRWSIDNEGKLVEGKEIYEFVGMHGDLMLMKTLNYSAAHAEDTMDPVVIKMATKKGYKPEIGNVVQLHYMYADRFKVIE